MKIKGKLTADVVGLQIKRDKSNDGREATVDFELGVSEPEAAEHWGEDFADLAFSTMRKRVIDIESGKEEIIFLTDSVKPNAEVVYEKHQISLEGEVFEAQPELLSISTTKGVARVVARMRIPVDVGRTALLSALSAKVGNSITVDFDPKQGSLFDRKKGRAKAKDAAPAADNDASPTPAAEQPAGGNVVAMKF